MRVVAHSKFSKDMHADWVAFYNNQAVNRASFTTEETLGIANDGEVLFTWEVTDFDQLSKHGADPEIQAHIARMQETASVYQAHDLQDDDGPGLYFGIFTFENESAEEWIKVWSTDDKRLTRNEVFAIVDDHSVAVLVEGTGTPEQVAAHLERPEVKEHVTRINEQARIWRLEPLELD